MTRTFPARTYDVRTFGCQMNEHDSERIRQQVGIGADADEPELGSELDPDDLPITLDG